MMNKKILEKVEREISALQAEEQKQLLYDLPSLLKIALDDMFLLKMAEKSFDFWNNPGDKIYDKL